MAPTTRSLVVPSLFAATILAFSAGLAEAGYGLRAAESAERDARALVEQQLFGELTALLGHGASHDRLARTEESMRTMYKALPKNEDGGIDQGVARYALNRYFLMNHGWHISGISADGQSWNSTSSTKALKAKMPSLVFELLEEHVGSKKLGLSDLAVLATTVEDLVHNEGIALLRAAYESHGLSTEEPLTSSSQEELIIQTFMLFYTMPWTVPHRTNITRLSEFLREAPEDNPAWADNMLWVSDVKGNMQYEDQIEHNPFSDSQDLLSEYPSMVRFTERLMDGFGLYQDMQCKELKHMMMELEEERKDGRVLLSKFYVPYSKGGHTFFVERPEYLENLGALDDTDPSRPSAIVPNFIYGRSFCLASENVFQSFCCIDQCNVLMDSLERSIAHPAAAPGTIAELVAGFSTDTVVGPRNLSGSLRRKLDLIAERHDGYVPLHGRMFAQFMHHAFPNECPQPRATGVTEAPMTHDEWRARRNMQSVVEETQLKELADLAAVSEDEKSSAEEEEEPSMLWTEEEELLTTFDLARPSSRGGRESMVRTALRFVALLAAIVSMVAIFSESTSPAVALWSRDAKGSKAQAGALPRWGSSSDGKSTFV